MKQKTTYLLALALLAASCTSEEVGNGKNTLSGDGKKTPIAIQTSIATEAISSRAVDKKFEKGDVLLAYIEAGVTTADGFNTADNPFKGLKTLTLTKEADNTDGDNHKDLYGYEVLPDDLHITETEDDALQTLYWDDYSSTEKDLRATGAGIRLKYGYCYNGGTPTGALSEADGTLTWTIGSQASADDMKHADLLFAKTQDPVTYVHGTEESNTHGVLILPYSHAMSKITINVTAKEGFSEEKANFASAELKLQHINTVCNVDAPAGTVTSTTQTAIGTYKSSATNTTATYQAIIAPGTNFSVGNVLATITNVDGNKYDIPITADLLTPWESKLTPGEKVSYGDVAQAKGSRAGSINAAMGYLTQSGVHYVLNVILDKQLITVRATLADWDKVEGNAKAQIIFNPDEIGKEDITSAELKDGGLDVYKSNDNSQFTLDNKATLVYNKETSKWEYKKTLYWDGQNDNSYFRAISPAGASTSGLAQGTNLLWSTSGSTAVTPRTGDVVLEDFQHLMSKLCINLTTSSNDAAKVNLEGAKIKITKLATQGSYEIADASVTAGAVDDVMLEGKSNGFTEYVIPQTIGDAAKLIITLADGTTYNLQLNQCLLTDTEAQITKWEKGKAYTYTIYLEKEKITFRALIKEWDEATGSGNATLEWD